MDITVNLAGEKKKIANTRDLASYIRESSEKVQEELRKKKEKIDRRIQAKLQSGKKLTIKEMNYLRRTNPVLYESAMRIQRMAVMVEEKLKHARSKEEADRILFWAYGAVSEKDPDRDFKIASLNRISGEFHKSKLYQELPDTEEEREKRKKHVSAPDPFEEEENDEEDFVLLTEDGELQELNDMLPAFDLKA